MLRHSRFPPRELWPEIEREHLREKLCTYEMYPHRLFCGNPAVSITKSGPRCEEHLEAS